MHKDTLLAATFVHESTCLATVDQTFHSGSKHLLNTGYVHCVIGNQNTCRYFPCGVLQFNVRVSRPKQGQLEFLTQELGPGTSEGFSFCVTGAIKCKLGTAENQILPH